MHLRVILFLLLSGIPGMVIAQSNLVAQELYFNDVQQYRSTFQYDAQGREVGSKHYSNTASGTWGLHSSEEKKFDEAGRQIFYSLSGWEYAYDSLYYYNEVQTSYNGNGKISNEITTVIYNASSSNEQKQKTEKEYRYDDSGCLTSIINRTYFEGGGTYEFTELYESDSQCRPLKRTYGNDVTIWTYEPDNSYTKHRYNIHDDGDSSLLIMERYNNNNLITEVIYSEQERFTYSYNSQGKLSEQKRFSRDDASWILKEQRSLTYNASNQVIKEENLVGPDVLLQPLLYRNTTTYEYNQFGSVWYMVSDWIDYNGGVYSQTSATTITFRCDGKELTSVSRNLKTGEDYMKTFYYYSTPAPCEEPAASFSFYPNPTTRFLKINTAEQIENAVLKIYNTNGQLLSEIEDTKKMTPIEVDLQHLIPGTYLLKVEGKGVIFSERFIKQ